MAGPTPAEAPSASSVSRPRQYLRPCRQFPDGYRAELRLLRLIRRKPQATAKFLVTAWLVGVLAGLLVTVPKVVARRLDGDDALESLAHGRAGEFLPPTSVTR